MGIMSCDIDIVIIGAGVVGLAVAAAVAHQNREVYIIEKNETFGRDTSSRNSGTIHTSILSPRGSLNARFCLEGNPLLFELCRTHKVDYRRTGKLLVACNKDEIAALDAMYQRREDGIEMQRLSRRDIARIEPEINGIEAVLLPGSGVVDPHALMRCYLAVARANGAQLVCQSEVIGLEKTADGYLTSIRDSAGISQLHSRVVINCAGLYSDRIAAIAGINIDKAGYRLSYFKGEFYSVRSTQARRMDRRLIYPMLKPGGVIAIHTVLDVDGRIRLGPDFYPVDEVDYSIDDSRREIFLEGVRKLFSFIAPEDIDPESAGIMPRRYPRGESFREFVVRHETDRGLPGFINALGIESPGITASPAIARYIAGMVNEILTPF